MAITLLKDLRTQFGPVRDQGSRPTCAAFATSDAHAIARQQPDPLSAEHLYYYAVQRTLNGHPDHGVSLPTTLDALKNDGQAAESGWPYLDSLPADLAAWAPPASAEPVYRRSSMLGIDTIDTICAHIDAGRPVVIVFMATESFYLPDAQGIVVPTAVDPATDLHAVVAVAHGVLAGERYLLVRNSWGLAWAIAGHAWISATYANTQLVATAIMEV